MKNKFRKGDRVIIAKMYTSDDQAYIGKIGTVDQNSSCPYVKLDESNQIRAFSETSLELYIESFEYIFVWLDKLIEKYEEKEL